MEVVMRDWSGMMAAHAALLERRTRAGVAEWMVRVRASGADGDEPSLRAWLTEQGVTGYPQNLLVREWFGYPDFLTASAENLIEAQYADRAHLRPTFDEILGAAQQLGPVTVQARKGYVSLVTPRRTFAVVRPTTKQRLDLGLRLADPPPTPRLKPAGGLANDAITVRLELASPADVDREVVELLGVAYAANA
jgi:hypothetical protein